MALRLPARSSSGRAKAGVQRPPYRRCELAGRERLLEQVHAVVQDGLVDQGRLGIARHVQHLQFRSFHRQPLRQLRTRQPGHHDVREQELDRA